MYIYLFYVFVIICKWSYISFKIFNLMWLCFVSKERYDITKNFTKLEFFYE